MTDPGAGAVVVTGAAGGIGSAIVRRLVASGTDVVAVDAAEAPGWVPDEFPGPGRVDRRTLSVADPDAVEAFADALAAEGREIRGLVNAAGVLHTGPVAETTVGQWSELFAVNALGVFAMSRAILRVMVGQRSADADNLRGIVTVASNAGRVPRFGMAAYGASKAAAAHFTTSLGLEAAAHGIRCNVVSPGTTRTPMVDAMWSGRDLSADVVAGSPETFKTGIPLGRVADPEDVAGIVGFLLTPEARHITLQEITVDGGASQR